MSDQSIIDAWLEKNGGARRFERGVSGDAQAIQRYLDSKGIQVGFYRGTWRIRNASGRWKPVKWAGVLEFADAARRADGLEPIVTPNPTHTREAVH